MTFSIVAQCKTSGQFGLAISSSSPAVGARCAHVRAGMGAVASQNVTDPALGPLALDALARGADAAAALAEVLTGYPHADYRQLLVVDSQGQTAVHSGVHVLGIWGMAQGVRCAAGGNLLAAKSIPQSMVAAFEAAQGTLAARLMTALEAGLAAGGEAGPVHSAALKVADRQSWPYIDLRVDWSETPIADLRAALTVYEPQADAYVQRALAPTAAPSFGVAGDNETPISPFPPAQGLAAMPDVNVVDLLARAISFDTVSANSNLSLVAWLESLLVPFGFACTRIPSPDRRKSGLVAVLGPAASGGLVLSAHTDVVPVQAQGWASDPFVLTPRGGRLYGRGATDMKGFLACVLAAAINAADLPRLRPLTLVFSYDEEVGCTGLRDMMPELAPMLRGAALCIVGEPTQLTPAVGHKGKAVYEIICHGTPGHSAMAPKFCNALHIAADAVQIIRGVQEQLKLHGSQDAAYLVPYTTLHVGALSGGGPVNVVPDVARLVVECRYLSGDDPEAIIGQIQRELDAALKSMNAPDARATFHLRNAYPGFAIDPEDAAVRKVKATTGNTSTIKVDYGTEAGYFAQIGLPTVVCGPGSMAQGHQPDEFVAEEQLQLGQIWLARLIREFA